MAHPGRERWQTALAGLRRDQERGRLTGARVRTVAEGLGVTERSVWRRLAAAAPPAERGRFRLSDTDRAAFVDFRGNVAAVHRARSAAITGNTTAAGMPIDERLVAGWVGAAPVGLRALQKAFAAELTPAQRAAAIGGDRAARAKMVYLRRRATRRNQVWEGDHKNLPILVLPPRGGAIRPWATVFIDDATRVITGWALSPTPHSGTVLTALRMGMLADDTGPATGVPGMLRLDRGLEFAADAVTAAAGVLGIDVYRLPAYSPHRKGKIERLNRTVEQTMLSTLPGFTGGPRNLNGSLAGPLNDSAAARAAAAEPDEGAVLPLPWQTFAARFADWVRWYNTQHRHSSLGKRTPASAWRSEDTPIIEVDEDVLRHLLLADVTRVIGAEGIRFRGLVYADPAGVIRGRRGERVQVRYMPHDDRAIHVYSGQTYLTTCYPDNALTEDQAEAYIASVRAQATAAANEKRSATRRARRRLAAASAETVEATETRRIPDPGQQPAPRWDAELQREADTSLLGIGPAVPLEPINLEDEDQPW